MCFKQQGITAFSVMVTDFKSFPKLEDSLNANLQHCTYMLEVQAFVWSSDLLNQNPLFAVVYTCRLFGLHGSMQCDSTCRALWIVFLSPPLDWKLHFYLQLKNIYKQNLDVFSNLAGLEDEKLIFGVITYLQPPSVKGILS